LIVYIVSGFHSNPDTTRKQNVSLMNSVIEQNDTLKHRITELEALLSRVAITDVASAKNRNATFDRMDAAVAELKTA